jgi:hypothetical protein
MKTTLIYIEGMLMNIYIESSRLLEYVVAYIMFVGLRHWNWVRSAQSVKYICQMCNYNIWVCAGRMFKLRQIESQSQFTQRSVTVEY